MLSDGSDSKEIYKIAKNIEDTLAQTLKIKTTIGIGTVVGHIRDLARAYKEAGVAIDVGKVFDTSGNVQHVVSITADCDGDALVVEVVMTEISSNETKITG